MAKERMTENKKLKLAYRILFAGIGWFGFLGHYLHGVLNRPAGWTIVYHSWNFFSYFTIQTNLLVVLWLSAAILQCKDVSQTGVLQPKIKGAVTLYITITFLVYAILLDRLWNPTGFPLLFTTISHYITPVAFILDWLLFEKRQTYQWRFLIHWMIYPLGYFAYTQLYGGITGIYLYPFVDLPALGWGNMMLWVVGLCLFFAVLGSGYIGLNRGMKSKTV